MCTQKPSAKNTNSITKKRDWVPDDLKPYLRDTPETRERLQRFEFFTPHAWNADELIEWIAKSLTLDCANALLSDKGYDRAREIFTQRREPTERWALSRVGWWESFEYYRERRLADYFIYAPPDISPQTLPMELESWWCLYIKEPVESEPRRRCAYLVAAGLLKENFSDDDLVRFAAKQRQKPSPDTTYAEWELTEAGDIFLTKKNTQKRAGTNASSHKNDSLDIAKLLEVNCWEGLTIEFHNTFIRAYPKTNAKTPRDISFDDMGIKKGTGNTPNKSFRLLVMLATESGKYNPEEDVDFYGDKDGLKRFRQDLLRLNKSLKYTFGLKRTPLSRSRKKEDRGIVKIRFELKREGDEKSFTDSGGKVKEIVAPEDTKRRKNKNMVEEDMEAILTETHKMKHRIS